METIQLIGIGKVAATEARNIIVGDTLVWNYGIAYEVVDIKPKGKASIEVTERSKDSKEYTRTMRLSRLVAKK